MVGLIMILVRGSGYAYSNEEEVVKYVAVMLPILAVSHVFDGIQSVLSGVARGCGWQKIGAIVNLGSFYIVRNSLGLSNSICFSCWRKGALDRDQCGSVVQDLLYAAITLRTKLGERGEEGEG
uniref:Uncharacterized protein n=1 Tax=Ananas comosus var. bracteatus TaxID=296719 RepID=A0A6V7Q5V4_ANACO|nr:unnamed protein product [Ananas comosus var. bracteatus]